MLTTILKGELGSVGWESQAFLSNLNWFEAMEVEVGGILRLCKHSHPVENRYCNLCRGMVNSIFLFLAWEKMWGPNIYRTIWKKCWHLPSICWAWSKSEFTVPFVALPETPTSLYLIQWWRTLERFSQQQKETANFASISKYKCCLILRRKIGVCCCAHVQRWFSSREHFAYRGPEFGS